MNVIPRIVEDLELVDPEGNEVFVSEVDEDSDTVILAMCDDEDEAYEIGLRELRAKLVSGEFAALVDDDEDGGEDEDDE